MVPLLLVRTTHWFLLILCTVDDVHVHTGHEKIRQFYETGVLSQRDFVPMPVEGSRRTVSPNAIQVDIFLHCKQWCRLVRDIFEFSENGLITRMNVTSVSSHIAPQPNS
jgi:hypothetical protein